MNLIMIVYDVHEYYMQVNSTLHNNNSPDECRVNTHWCDLLQNA